MKLTTEHLEGLRQRSDLLHSEAEVEKALDRMAGEISSLLFGTDPVVLCVMNGGVIPMGKLLPRLNFPLRQDYVHATRYRGETSGSELHWIHHPKESLEGQCVLLVDDILDEGITLAELVRACEDAGAERVYSAVLVEKLHDRNNGFRPDFIGLQVEDRYVYGYGMDYRGYLRNAAGIFAVSDQDV